MARTSTSAQALTDHDEIRQWAEERGGTPACVRGTGGDEDVGLITLDFPGYSGGTSLQEISWDEWFRKFDESNLALLVQEQTARGQQSNFNKLVSRGSVQQTGQRRGRRQSGREQRRSAANGHGRSNQRRGSATSKHSSASRSRGTKSSRSRTRGSSRGRELTRTRARSRANDSSGSRTKARSSSSRRSASNARSSESNVRSIRKRSAAANRSSGRRRAA